MPVKAFDLGSMTATEVFRRQAEFYERLNAILAEAADKVVNPPLFVDAFDHIMGVVQVDLNRDLYAISSS